VPGMSSVLPLYPRACVTRTRQTQEEDAKTERVATRPFLWSGSCHRSSYRCSTKDTEWRPKGLANDTTTSLQCEAVSVVAEYTFGLRLRGNVGRSWPLYTVSKRRGSKTDAFRGWRDGVAFSPASGASGRLPCERGYAPPRESYRLARGVNSRVAKRPQQGRRRTRVRAELCRRKRGSTVRLWAYRCDSRCPRTAELLTTRSSEARCDRKQNG